MLFARQDHTIEGAKFRDGLRQGVFHGTDLAGTEQYEKGDEAGPQGGDSQHDYSFAEK